MVDFHAMVDETAPPVPMSISDIQAIASVVEARLRIHLPNLEREVHFDGERVVLVNPSNKQKIILYALYKPSRDGSFGYRVWAIEAIPELLAHLLQTGVQTGSA